MQYRFTKPYRSDFGVYAAGDVAEFDDETAAWLNRDEPGCLEAATSPEAEARAVAEAPETRQVTKASNRGAMSTKDSKLVKGGD